MILTFSSLPPDTRTSRSAAIRAASAKKKKNSRMSAFRKDAIIE
jgi:hypothetical protein